MQSAQGPYGFDEDPQYSWSMDVLDTRQAARLATGSRLLLGDVGGVPVRRCRAW